MPFKTHQQRFLAQQRGQLLTWLILACAVLLFALAGPWLIGHVYTHDDLGALHLPLRAFYASCLLYDRSFDWMPHLFNGFYLTGEGQAGTYHPAQRLFYQWLPFTSAFNLNLFISYPALLIGTYCFLRRRVRRRHAALFGSLLFTFSGFNLLHFSHMNAIAVVAHLPWLLWAIDIALRSHDRRRALAAELLIALLTASQLLIGYPQYVWFTLLAAATYATLLVINSPTLFKRLGWIVAAQFLGLALGSVQLLPTVDALFASARHDAQTTFADWGSLAPINVVQLVAPYLSTTRVVGQNTHELGLYFGAVPLLLVVWLLTPRREPGRLRRFGWIAACCAVAAYLLALGQYGPLHPVFSRLPLIGNFRFPCRAIVLVHFSLAIAATAAWVDLAHRIEQQKQAHWSQLIPLWSTALLSILVIVWATYAWDPRYLAAPPLQLVGPLLLFVAAGLLTAAARGSHIALLAAALLAAADLGIYGLSYSVYPHSTTFENYLAQAQLPPGTNQNRFAGDLVRFDHSAIHMGDQALLAGYRRVDGYLGLEPARQLDYRTLPALQLSGVRWVARSALAEANELQPLNDRWLQVPNPLPRARCVTRAHYSDNPADGLQTLQFEQAATLHRFLPLDGGPPAHVEILADCPGHIELRVDSPSQQLLVLAESYHSGWQVTVDGQPAEAYRVNGDFLGCVVNRHAQLVHWNFRPASLRYGWRLTLIGLASTLGFAAFRFHNTRPTDRSS